MARRALHYVLRIGDRARTMAFYKNVMGMSVLRHEEFEEGCKATCNGPYDGRWSKTMIGYGCEDDNFVIELTYNYGIGAYTKGNDLQHMEVRGALLPQQLQGRGLNGAILNGCLRVRDPDGNQLVVVDDPDVQGHAYISQVCISAKDLASCQQFWTRVCGMGMKETGDKFAVMAMPDSKFELRVQHLDADLDRGKAFGRIAFSCPASQLKSIESLAAASQGSVVTPYVALETPGKTTVHVVIIGDPSLHEICFVGDESFRELSKEDANADQLLSKAISTDDSWQWFAKQGGKDTM